MQHSAETNGQPTPIAPVVTESAPAAHNNSKPTVVMGAYPVVIDAERVMPRIRDTLFRELQDIQSGQASTERTATVLMIVDKIVDSLDYDEPQTLIQAIATPAGQEAAQLTNSIINQEAAAPTEKPQPKTGGG